MHHVASVVVEWASMMSEQDTYKAKGLSVAGHGEYAMQRTGEGGKGRWKKGMCSEEGEGKREKATRSVAINGFAQG